MTTRGSAGRGGPFRAGLDTIRQWPALLLPGIVIHVLVVGFMLPLAAGAFDFLSVIGGVFRGWEGVLLGILAAVLAIGLVLGIPTLLASAVVVVMARDVLAGRSPGLGRALRAVMGRLPAVVGMSVVAIIVVSLGFFILVVPGVIASIGFVFALPAVLLDRARAMGALRRSVGLVGQNLGPSLGLGGGFCVWLQLLLVATYIPEPALARIGTAGLAGAAMSYWSVIVVHVYQALPRRSEG